MYTYIDYCEIPEREPQNTDIPWVVTATKLVGVVQTKKIGRSFLNACTYQNK